MKKGSKYDMNLFFVTCLLVALGLIMVFSASQVIAREQFSSSFFFIQRHAIRVGIGMCCLFVFMKIPFGIYRKVSVWGLGLAVFLLVSIFIWGHEARGASRWLPVFKFMLQPVEVAKFALIIFISAWISERRNKIKDFKTGYLPVLGIVLLIAGLVVLQPNVSNATLIVVLSLVLLFIGGCRIIHLVTSTGIMAAVAVPILYSFPHVRERFSALLDRGSDIQGQGWQLNQSLIAIGSGFICGCGPGRGHQKYSFLPDAHTDFIYSIIGEEFGLIGTLVVLTLFIVIFKKAVGTAKRAPDTFGYLLANGIGLAIFSTAIINISMTLGLIPIVGLPLPFVSYGGSSLVTSMSAIGILLNISSRGRKSSKRASKNLGRYGRTIYARRRPAEDPV
ncbi:MAG: putative lipid II flippase FtsW [Bacteroidales bacterium]|nr:putative lipid II flippase FtsW [Candidatus Latescibacterota bacterium]